MDKRNKTKLNYFYKTLLTLLIVSLYLLLYIGSNGDGTSTAESGTGKELISAPKDGISFKVSSENNNYGFDAIKDKEDAYISLEAEIDKSTNFNVIVKDNPNGAMASPWSYILNIVGSDYNGNYFLNNNETTELTITSLEGNEARTMIEIYGCTGELDGYDDCNIYENQLNVELYKKKVIKQLNVILLNGAVFPSSADELRNYMNSILKQAVYKINYVLFSEWTLSDFDANKNGHLDLWATQPVPDDDELDDITDIGFGRGWWSYDEPGIAVLNENIKTHWGVEYETSAGDNEINLEDVAAYIEEETYLTIGPLPGNDGTAEKFYVNYKSEDILGVQQTENNIDGLIHPHSDEETVYSTDYGFLGEVFVEKNNDEIAKNFAVLSPNADEYVAVHEFLHFNMVGQLKDVTEKENIMYPDVVGERGTLLRYREIICIDGTPTMQWDDMQSARQ